MIVITANLEQEAVVLVEQEAILAADLLTMAVAEEVVEYGRVTELDTLAVAAAADSKAEEEPVLVEAVLAAAVPVLEVILLFTAAAVVAEAVEAALLVPAIKAL